MSKDGETSGWVVLGGFIAIVIVVVIVFGLFAIYGSDGGPVTEESRELCSADNMALSSVLWVETNRCYITDCNNEYDGITFCTSKSFRMHEGKFLGYRSS